jgi:hypothetical protein
MQSPPPPAATAATAATAAAAAGVYLRRVSDALVLHPSNDPGGLCLDPWQHEGAVTATAAVHVASQRNQGMYGFSGSRTPADPDVLAGIQEAGVFVGCERGGGGYDQRAGAGGGANEVTGWRVFHEA